MRGSLLRYGVVVLCLAALWAAGGGGAGAQTGSAALRGVVVGASEEAVAGSRVTVAAVGGGEAARTVTTDEAGEYGFASLPPGAYRVTVEAEGFKTVVLESLQLAVGDAQRLKFTLEAGSAREVIVIPAENPPAPFEGG